ncbi:hypothetical protein [Proteus mirabilis]|nr:hypothetical protein [Proteus mirabilis]MDC9735086.1 hypothetical protein [Proteus mirabilis]MDC9773892.1 hypothetical protein [Proteus mirabilis]MDC9781200.1 hypothetical protein [Proteus mirabilis]
MSRLSNLACRTQVRASIRDGRLSMKLKYQMATKKPTTNLCVGW